MTVYDLNRDQLTELKQRYYAEETGHDLSYEELANIDFYVTDYDVQQEYAGTHFTNDDFFCSAGQDGEDVRLNVAIKNSINYIIDNVTSVGYIPFESPRPSSTEMQLRRAVMGAIEKLNEAYKLAHKLGY